MATSRPSVRSRGAIDFAHATRADRRRDRVVPEASADHAGSFKSLLGATNVAILPEMNPAVASLLALLAVIVASLFSRVNVGVLAVALAWPIALFGAGWKADALIQTFPSSLFLTLVGVSLLFGVSQANGTMEAVTQRAVRMCRGRAAMLPPLLFFLACTVATLGPGAISATALVAPAGDGDRSGRGSSAVPDGADGGQRCECGEPVTDQRRGGDRADA